MEASSHAQKRIRKRMGVPVKAVERVVSAIDKNGIEKRNIKNKDLIKWIEEKEFDNRKGIVFNEFLFVIEGKRIITVLNIPFSVRKKPLKIR